jgi:hypothetical protein
MAHSRKIVTALLVAVLAPATRATAVPSPGPLNLLVNPGFETGSLSGWSIGGTSPQVGVAMDNTPIPDQGILTPAQRPAFQNVRSGDFAANALVADFLQVLPFWNVEFAQTVAVVPNRDYVVGFWLGADPTGFGMFVDDQHTQIFVDGLGVLVPRFASIMGGPGPDDFKSFSAIFNSGSRTSVDVTFTMVGVRGAPSFDDFFVAEPEFVPEPGTLSLLVLGLVGASLRRRSQ